MKRILFLVGGAAAIFASYMAVIFGLAPAESFGSVTLAQIALPALVSGLVMTFFIASEARNERETSGQLHELNAQLARKEIEIGRLSATDDLTGLYTRHHFDANAKLEFERANRHGRPLALLLIEIDDVDGAGERMGALTSNYLLSEVGALLRTLLRINDIGSRYTPSTLAVLLPETNAQQAALVCEKLRKLVAEREFLPQRTDSTLLITISQGIAVAPSADISAPNEFLRAGERALGSAQAAGIDQVFVAQRVIPMASRLVEHEQLAS